MEQCMHENAVFSSSCQYTYGVARWLSWPHNTSMCVLIYYIYIYIYPMENDLQERSTFLEILANILQVDFVLKESQLGIFF